MYFEKNAAILIHKSLFSALQAEMGEEIKNLKVLNSPLRFRDVTNPEVLINVFNFYVQMDPKAGRYI
ncbi:MAG: hypothetical protein JW976_15225 [Syntrophaceae bacterium]|nr:hypothetical protein [Syntrophaceae bacterium]